MKIAYKHTLLNPPKQPCLIHNPLRNVHTSCLYHHKPTPPRLLNHGISPPNLICVVHKTHSSSSTKSWYIIPTPNLYRPQPHSAPSTSSSCIIRCTMVFRLLTHPVFSLNPPYIASTPTFSTRSFKAFFFTTHKKRRSKKLLSFTSSSLISISRPTSLMRDYP